MSHTNQDTIIIHGKQPVNNFNNLNNNVQLRTDTNHTNRLNASALERNIDSGKITMPKTIPLDIAHMFRDERMKLKNKDGNSLTQDAFAKQMVVKNVDASFIKMLEGGTLLLNHQNKTAIRTLQKKLKLSKFNLP